MSDSFIKNLSLKIPKYKTLHFIGIMGSGMCPLALLFTKLGYKVQGSDTSKNDAVRNLLKGQGIEIFSQHAEQNILNSDVVVFSSAIQEAHCEILSAKNSGKILLHRSDILSFLANTFPSICVAGTHGKTTTSAMIAHMLAVLVPSSFACVGGMLKNYDSPVYFPQDGIDLETLSYFVAEADESDGSFLKYNPLISVINNCEEDHMDFYKDKNHLFDQFKKYISQIREDGFLIAGWDCPNLRNLSYDYSGNKLAFGFSLGSDVRAIDRKYSDFKNADDHFLQSFTAIVERDQLKVKLQVPGKHNVLNALATLAVARSLELDIEQAAITLSTFQGVKRRLEKIADLKSNISIYDDYAHNPGKIKACVQSLRELYPSRELRIIFQPHRYSRLRTLYNEFIESMVGADKVYVTDVYSAGEEVDLNYRVEEFVRNLSTASQTIARHVLDSEILEVSVKGVQRDCVFLCIGAGDVWKFSKKIEEYFSKKIQK